MNDDKLAGFELFASAVRKRLDAGRETYADRSFDRDPAELLGELAEEALDLAGWGYVLWARVHQLALEAHQAQSRLRADRPR